MNHDEQRIWLIKQLLAESTTTSAFAKFELAYKLGSLAVAVFTS